MFSHAIKTSVPVCKRQRLELKLTNNTKKKSITKILKLARNIAACLQKAETWRDIDQQYKDIDNYIDIEIGTEYQWYYHRLFAKGKAAALFPERFPSGSPLSSPTIRSYHRAGHLLSSSSSLLSFSSSSYFSSSFSSPALSWSLSWGQLLSSSSSSLSFSSLPSFTSSFSFSSSSSSSLWACVSQERYVVCCFYLSHSLPIHLNYDLKYIAVLLVLLIFFQERYVLCCFISLSANSNYDLKYIAISLFLSIFFQERYVFCYFYLSFFLC